MADVILGIDYGKRKTGLAVGQTITGTASPLETFSSKDAHQTCEIILKKSREWSAKILVIGLPVHVDGSDSEWTATVRGFAVQLATFLADKAPNRALYFVDERLTSKEAKNLQKAALQRGQGRAAIDSLAAVLIVENYLNAPEQALPVMS